MATKEKYTGYYSHKITLNKNSTSMLEFKENTPNYFRVSNNGTSTIYCSTSSYPTSTQYDFKVDGGQSKVFAEPYYRDRIYFYNPSISENIPVTVKSFSAEFDPSVFALGELGMEVTGQVTTDGIIKGFETSLPRGNNIIGSVDVNTFGGFDYVDTRPVEIWDNMSLNSVEENKSADIRVTKLKYLYSDSDFEISTKNQALKVKMKGGYPYIDFFYFERETIVNIYAKESPVYYITMER